MTTAHRGDGLDWPKLFATRAERMKASEIRELLKLLDQPDVISFAGGIPDPALFPAQAFSEALAQSLSGGQADQALQYSVSEGYLPLRQWLAERMGSLGVKCAADNIVITTGSQQALDFLGKLFLSPGDTALVGWPTYLGALQAFNAYEPRYDKLNPMGNRAPAGFKSAAEAAGGKVKFAYLSADFANPTGETVTREARERVLDLAEALDIPVIEDAAYQSLRYEGEEIPPILALDLMRHGGDIEKTRTLYCGSFSKTLAPGLRVGWVCGATPVIQKLVLTKQAADLHSSTLNQMAIHKVASADFAGQVARIKAAYQSRRDTMLKALGAEMPAGVSWTHPDGGMFVWITLPEGFDGAELLAECLKSEKVAFVPGKAFFADGSGANTIRLSFSRMAEKTIAEGVARLGRVLRHKGA